MPVKVYTRTTCGPCRTLKHFLKVKNIPYEEINVDTDPKLMDYVIERSGYQMVPMTLIGDTVISGLNLGAIMNAISGALMPTVVDPQEALNCEGCQ